LNPKNCRKFLRRYRKFLRPQTQSSVKIYLVGARCDVWQAHLLSFLIATSSSAFGFEAAGSKQFFYRRLAGSAASELGI
jgi:hypothetical protein